MREGGGVILGYVGLPMNCKDRRENKREIAIEFRFLEIGI